MLPEAAIIRDQLFQKIDAILTNPTFNLAELKAILVQLKAWVNRGQV